MKRTDSRICGSRKSIANCPGEPFEIDPLQIFGTEFSRAEIELYLFDRTSEIFRQHFRIFEFRHDRQTVVGADVHATVSGETKRHRVLKFAFGLLFAVHEKPTRAARGELSGFISDEFISHIDFSRGQRIARTDGVQFQAKQAVGVFEMAVLNVKREAAEETGLSNDHARYSRAQPKCASMAWMIEIGADAVGTIVDRRDHA